MQPVFFDVDGVLIHGYHARPELRKCWDENLLEDWGIEREQFAQDFIFGPFMKEVIIGKKDLKAALTDFLPTWGCHHDPQDFIDYWLKKDSNVNHALLEKIKILKQSKQVRLFIATNQEHNRARYLMNELGFKDYFEDIYYSARVGTRKPDPAYFRYITDDLNLTDSPRPIFFDDTPAVVAAARDFGWDTIEFLGVENLHDNAIIDKLLKK